MRNASFPAPDFVYPSREGCPDALHPRGLGPVMLKAIPAALVRHQFGDDARSGAPDGGIVRFRPSLCDLQSNGVIAETQAMGMRNDAQEVAVTFCSDEHVSVGWRVDHQHNDGTNSRKMPKTLPLLVVSASGKIVPSVDDWGSGDEAMSRVSRCSERICLCSRVCTARRRCVCAPGARSRRRGGFVKFGLSRPHHEILHRLS